MILEDFQTAFQSFRNNKGRTLLSLIGIMIGITCVIAVTTLGTSLKAMAVKMYEKMNPNSVFVVPSYFMGGGNVHPINFNDEFKQKLKENVPNIKAVYYATLLETNQVVRDMVLGRDVWGVDYGWLESTGMRLARGKGFTLADYAEGNHKMIIGEKVSELFFQEEDPIGKTIWLYIRNNDTNGPKTIPKAFEIVGVIENTFSWFQQPRHYIAIPRMFCIREGFEFYHVNINVVANDKKHAKAIEDGIKAYTEQVSGSPDIVRAWSMERIIQNKMNLINLMAVVLGGIAALSILVGGIGIMNIMIVTVTERKQEIGLRKAIGASKLNIITQFLAESSALSIIGAVLGCGFGLLISYGLISLLNNLNTGEGPAGAELVLVPDINGMIIAVTISVFIGVFFGLYPALQAAKLDPVITLKEE